MKKLTVSQILQVANLIADLPNTDQGESDDLAQWLDVESVEYVKDGDNMKFTIYQQDNSNNILEPSYMELSALELLKMLGNWKAAIAFAMVQEHEQYADHVMPFQWIRCATLSALMGFDSGYNLNPEAALEDFTESDNGVFFGSRNNIKVVFSTGEKVYEIAQFLEWAI